MDSLEFLAVHTMKEFLQRLFLTNWPRKLVALFSAVIIWFLVTQSITITRTLPDVAVRIINLPPDKTVVGLLPNGLLNKRIAVNITGNKSFVEDLTPTDIEIVINAEGKKESWIATINKKSLVNLTPEVDLKKHITDVNANDLLIKLSKLVTVEVPVIITIPIGDPPKGYQFLDVWPKRLVQKVSGPQEQVEALKERGLDLTFNLNKITKAELDALQDVQEEDEISFFVPSSWKQVAIPFRDNALEPLNDPRADFLRIDFLKQESIPLDTQLPITIFFPLKYSRTLNPETYSLATGEIVEKKNGLKVLTLPLFAREVSRLFIEVVKDNLELTISAAPTSVQENLSWTVEVIDEAALEDAYVIASLKQEDEQYEEGLPKYSEQYLRSRFQDYIRQFVLYTSDEEPLELVAKLEGNTITLTKQQ